MSDNKIASESFASDNYSPVHPKVMERIAKINKGFDKSYGFDKENELLQENIERVFGIGKTAYLFATGTGANVVGLSALCERFEAVLAAENSHINVDEGGSPERFGIKIYPIRTVDWKIDENGVARELFGFGDQHRAQPGVLSITQSNEMGRVYSQEEITKLIKLVRPYKLRTHLDGARLANALASSDVSAKKMVEGFDLISLGMTKNGGLAAEALLVRDCDLKDKIQYLRKSGTQLLSKSRYIAAQFNALLENDLWIENANNSNLTAKYLYELLADVKGVQLVMPPEANAIFVRVDSQYLEKISEELGFYIWDRESKLVRFMTSWCSTREGVERFVKELSELLRNN